jgi:hypothetical protein
MRADRLARSAEKGIDPIREENTELEENLAPVMNATGPSKQDVVCDEIPHFKQYLISWEDGFSLEYINKM